MLTRPSLVYYLACVGLMLFFAAAEASKLSINADKLQKVLSAMPVEKLPDQFRDVTNRK